MPFCFLRKNADLCTIRFLNRVQFVFAIIHSPNQPAHIYAIADDAHGLLLVSLLHVAGRHAV
jgi:hypothetical protein